MEEVQQVVIEEAEQYLLQEKLRHAITLDQSEKPPYDEK
jgi:hypothetical protein